MKFLVTVLLAASVQAFAQGADQTSEVLNCRPLNLIPDNGMSLTLTTGGIAGLTQIRIQHFFLGHNTAKTFIVRQQPVDPRLLGASMAYKGNDIDFSANFTTAALPDGGHIGHIAVAGSTQAFENGELSCRLADQTIAQVRSVNIDIRSVELTASGLIKVEKYDGDELSKQLVSRDAAQLIAEAKNLGEAELNVQQRLAVCHIVVDSRLLQNLYVTKAGQLTEVLGSNSCTLTKQVQPLNLQQEKNAEMLEANLISLALQLAGN